MLESILISKFWWLNNCSHSVYFLKSFLYEAEEFVSYYALKSSLLALLETLLVHRIATQYLSYPPIPAAVSFFPFMSSPKDDGDDDELFHVTTDISIRPAVSCCPELFFIGNNHIFDME